LTTTEEEKAEERKGEDRVEAELFDVHAPYLNSETDTAGTLIKCNHFAHMSCLNNYLTSKETDMSLFQRNLQQILGLSIETFLCPVCKQISNTLHPCEMV